MFVGTWLIARSSVKSVPGTCSKRSQQSEFTIFFWQEGDVSLLRSRQAGFAVAGKYRESSTCVTSSGRLAFMTRPRTIEVRGANPGQRGAARTAGRESVEPVLRTREVFKERATRTTHELVGRGAASTPVSILLGYLGSCFLGLVQGLEFHHATRVNARSDLPIPGAVPKESVESVGTRYPDGRGVHLFCGTELFDRQATPPPGRIAASEPLHPVDPAPERCPF